MMVWGGGADAAAGQRAAAAADGGAWDAAGAPLQQLPQQRQQPATAQQLQQLQQHQQLQQQHPHHQHPQHPQHHHQHHQTHPEQQAQQPQPPPAAGRKRKAASQDGERRLSKRLSLLNLERNGSKLYIPVETPSPPHPQHHHAHPDPDAMQLDDTRHKVYIYNMDDELSSDSDADDARLVFLPDIDRHLRQSRIPPHVLAAPDPDPDRAGMQLVLYNDPRSLSVPEHRDGVRRAILDSRRRLRERQGRERDGEGAEPAGLGPSTHAADTVDDADVVDDADAMDVDMCTRNIP